MSSPASRTFTRVPTHVRAEYRIGDAPVVSGVAEDVSMNGMRVHADDQPEVGAKAWIEIVLESGTDELRIHADGEVCRVEAGEVAFHFDHVQGDDFEHLEKLVLFNARDTARVEQELHLHADDQPPLSDPDDG